MLTARRPSYAPATARPDDRGTLRRGWMAMKIGTACDEFIAFKKLGGARPRTLQTYSGAIRQFEVHVIATAGPKAGVSHFTSDRVVDWLTTLQGRDLARKTMAIYQTSLREFAKWGLRRRYWRDDPMLDVPVIDYPRTLPRPFSPEERNALMALDLPLDQRALRAILYYVGLRDAAICGIRLRDVHGPEVLPTGREIRARVRTVGKGGKERWKGLHAKAWAAIEAYIETRAHEDRVPTAPLFAKGDGAPWSTRMIQDRVHAWGVATGVSPCVPHRFRHTFATNLLEHTNDVRLVQEALDHASLATTQIYTLVVNQRLEDAMAGLPSFDDEPIAPMRADYADHPVVDSGPPETPIT